MRHLFRLGLLTVLVLMVMRGAANPKVYEPFFYEENATDGNSGGADRNSIPTDSLSLQSQVDSGTENLSANQNPTGDPGSSDESRADSIAELANGKAGPPLAQGYVDAIDLADRGAWIAWLAAVSDAEFQNTNLIDLFLEDAVKSGSVEVPFPMSLGDRFGATLDAWLELAGTLDPLPDDSNPNDRKEAKLSRAGLLDGLRRDAMSRVRDGSVFRGADGDAMYDLIARSGRGDVGQKKGLSANVVALLQQPSFYRGRIIEVIGSVALVQTIPAKENPFGVNEFRQTWIRPDSGAERPLVFISPVSDKTAPVAGDKVFARGVYLKRLSYQSGIGADLAPVLVGKFARPERVIAKTIAASTRRGSEPMTMAGISVWVWLAVALLMGIGVASLIMSRSRRSALRLQAIRNQMPAQLPPSLLAPSPPSESPVSQENPRIPKNDDE